MHFSGIKARFLRTCALFFVIISIFSCLGHIGYGVINWSLPEQGLVAGDIVPVFIQSNIGKVYVVGTGKGPQKRIEIPLWQLTLYKSKAQAKKSAKAMEEYRYMYASVKLDGLPIRAMPENTARQVYRLKEGQIIKILRKGEGAPVTALSGDWLEVMADDGSSGWCFSYNLTLFDERDPASALQGDTDEGPDTVLENLLARSWYPESYGKMIETNQIDITRIQPLWGFYPGKDSLVARIENADGVVTFPYTAIVRPEKGTYQFEGSSLSVQVRRNNTIAVQYTDENGMPQIHYFISLDISPEQLIENERERRVDVLQTIRKAGPRFTSGNYGVLQFLENGRFLWSGYQLLTPSTIPMGAGSVGVVENRCFLSETLASGYTGSLSFQFDGTQGWVHFLYTLTSQGLKLEQVSDVNIKDSLILAQNITPVILFFTPGNAKQGGF